MTPDQEQLVLDNLGYARNIAMKLLSGLPKGPVFDQDDVVQMAHIGLIQAATRYDPTKVQTHDPDKSFRSYAYTRIAGAVIDECRRLTFVKRSGMQRGDTIQMLSINFDEQDDDGKPRENRISLDWNEDPDGVIDFKMALERLPEHAQIVAIAQACGLKNAEISAITGLNAAQIAEHGSYARAHLQYGMR